MTEAGGKTLFETSSPGETLALGKRLGTALVEGTTIGLCGPLGAGKTQLVKGIALGNGLADAATVTSPTFTLIHEYEGRVPLYHLDAYRLENEKELAALGFDELMGFEALVVVEWADRVRAAMPTDMIWVEIAPTGENRRKFAFQAGGPISGRSFQRFLSDVR